MYSFGFPGSHSHSLGLTCSHVFSRVFIPQTACCRGSDGVGTRGLDPCRECAALPASTPTFKTPGKVTKKRTVVVFGLNGNDPTHTKSMLSKSLTTITHGHHFYYICATPLGGHNISYTFPIPIMGFFCQSLAKMSKLVQTQAVSLELKQFSSMSIGLVL